MVKNNCADCIHKDVCALWEIQTEISDTECVYYQPTPTPPNEPLTLDELREMNGEPVYDAKGKKWHVIETVGNCFVEMTDGAIFDSDIWYDNLTDRLYRRPPEVQS